MSHYGNTLMSIRVESADFTLKEKFSAKLAEISCLELVTLEGKNFAKNRRYRHIKGWAR